ncbi:hypothetical protein MAR_004112 [Mya arenaria]|uniref:Uncharacterized protein n=1 Tax=Mya arenaria TaxID=6604 RepID=A0ABY7EYR3_MYAAR|nr:hypothetical protein MAR_004112 [Mya arenaria]
MTQIVPAQAHNENYWPLSPMFDSDTTISYSSSTMQYKRQNSKINVYVTMEEQHTQVVPSVVPTVVSGLFDNSESDENTDYLTSDNYTIVKKTVSYLNPGQIPVMAADQPLFALAKQIQWTWPNDFDEEMFVVMFGGLHIELAALKTIGDLLQDSGWSSVLTQANIATPGTADSFLKATNISRTRHAHQVTSAALYVLMKQQYDEYVEATKDEIGPEMSLEMWVDVRQNESPISTMQYKRQNSKINVYVTMEDNKHAQIVPSVVPTVVSCLFDNYDGFIDYSTKPRSS